MASIRTELKKAMETGSIVEIEFGGRGSNTMGVPKEIGTDYVLMPKQTGTGEYIIPITQIEFITK